MLWLDDEDDEGDDPRGWQQHGNRWVAHRDDKTLMVEKVGWFFPFWRYSVILHEGAGDTLADAMEKAERVGTKRTRVLRLVRK